MRILHVIVGLDVGGAEKMLTRLVDSFSMSPDYEHIVVSLTDEGDLGAELRCRRIDTYSLGMRSVLSIPVVVWRLIRLIRLLSPDVVQTWMYHSDFLGGLAARLAGSSSVVWNVRSSTIPQGKFSTTYWLVRVCAIFSHFIPDRIICCAKSAKVAHEKLLYARHKMIVIPNGYDFIAFERNPKSIAMTREELGIFDEDIIIGVVGRFDPLKDFRNFVMSASHVSAKLENVKYLMVGRGNVWSNAELHSWIESAGMTRKFILVGQQADVNSYLSAMDIFCLSSVSEAFPNVVVEAMAIGLPCVVTRAGDAADILEDDNFVVSVGDSMSLADKLIQMCEFGPDKRRRLGEDNSIRVKNKYGIDKIRRKYEKVYEEITKK